MFSIYKARNTINGKIYIGKDADWPHRQTKHIRMALKNSQLVFHRALRKYGSDAFEWSIIDSCETNEEACRLEIFYIDKLQSFVNGYNMTIGGEGGNTSPGRVLSEEEKERLRTLRLGKKQPKEAVEKTMAAVRGKKQSSEHIAKKVASRAGYTMADETKERISLANTGKTAWNKGLKGSQKPTVFTDEMKKQLSERNKGKKRLYREDGSWTWVFPS